jgi:hypothetical protein
MIQKAFLVIDWVKRFMAESNVRNCISS